MTKTVDMVVNAKKSIIDNSEIRKVFEAINFRLYREGVYKTADEFNSAWNAVILNILYNGNKQARNIINQEVYDAISQ